MFLLPPVPEAHPRHPVFTSSTTVPADRYCLGTYHRVANQTSHGEWRANGSLDFAWDHEKIFRLQEEARRRGYWLTKTVRAYELTQGGVIVHVHRTAFKPALLDIERYLCSLMSTTFPLVSLCGDDSILLSSSRPYYHCHNLGDGCDTALDEDE